MSDSQTTPDLTTLLVDAVGDRSAAWLAANAVDERGAPVMSRQTAWDLLGGTPRTDWIKKHRMKAIARLFKWQDAVVYTSNAVEIGLDPPRTGTFATLMPTWVDRLPIGDQMAIRDHAISLGRARGLTD